MAELPVAQSPTASGQSDDAKVAAAARTLALLDKQAEDVREELLRLQRGLAEVQERFSALPAAQLMEANEQLVLAALQAETVAEAAVDNLGELTRASQRDALTDTPNRALLSDRLESAMAMARRHQTRVAVIFLDLDHFKQINDRFGHAVGDQVLERVARLLESVVRESDTVSRHSGDEFVVLLSAISQESDAALIATKMLAALAAPCIVGDHLLQLSASLGITVFPEDGDDAPTLIGLADTAMFRSKRLGPGGFEFHGQEKAGEGNSRKSTEALLCEPIRPLQAESAESEPHLRSLRDTNEQLAISAVQQIETQAEEAHRRQIRFLAMVAHELRNPLTPIRTAAELLNRAPGDEPLLAKLQGIIKRRVAHMSRLVDNLLQGSRVDGAGFRLEHDTVDMAEIFSLAVATCRPALDRRLQYFAMQLPPGPFGVHGDPVRLAQIFTNLLDNASKYTPRGGRIALAVTVSDHDMAVAISDNGIGITAEAMPNIFNLFAQDKKGLRRRHSRLGIGLAVVRELVGAHGGSVVAKSAGRNLGSEFVVELPLADRAAVELID